MRRGGVESTDVVGSSSTIYLRAGAAWLVLVLAAACATNPVTGKCEFSLLSEAQELQIGQEQEAQNDQPRAGERLKIVVAG